MARSLSYRDITWFFVPLLLWGQLMMTTHAVIQAGLARLPQPTLVLAAYAVAIALHSALSSAIMVMTQVGIAFLTDRRSVYRLFAFGLQPVAFAMAVSALVAFTPVGEMLYSGLFGASLPVAEEAKRTTLVLAIIFPVQMTRNLFISLLMKERRTVWISIGTGIRLSTLAGFLFLLHGRLHGAQLGAASLGLCMVVEMLVMAAAALPHYLRMAPREGTVASYLEMWRFAWPVMVSQLTENAIAFSINFFLGRLAQPDLALAAFGVVRALAMLLLSPLRNVAQTAQALVHDRAELRMMMRFTVGSVALFTALMVVLFFTPLQHWVLRGAMGLEPRLASYSAAATLVFALMPLAWSLAALFRGLLAGQRLTGPMATSGVARLVAVMAVSSVCLLFPQANGALVGIVATASGFVIEAVLLGRYLVVQLRNGRAFPIAAHST